MRVLLVVARYPWPPHQGDRKRARQTMAALAGEHELTLLAPEPPPGIDEAQALAGLPPVRVEHYRRGGWAARGIAMARAALAGRPLQAGLHEHGDLGRRLRRLAPQHDLAILHLVRLAGFVRDLGELPLIVDFIDSLALNFERRARYDRPWRSPGLRWEARRLARWERRLLEHCRLGLVVSERDRQKLLELLPAAGERVRVIPIAEPVQRPPDEGPGGELAQSTGGEPAAATLALTGNLGYFPNVDAACWFLREVWPRLAQRRPALRLLIAGARPAARLRAAVRRSLAWGGGGDGAQVRLIANPPDLRSLLASATLSLAPLRAGSGLPIKILEAWSAGVPVVASPWAAAGVAAAEQAAAADGGRAGRALWIAETPESWCAAIEHLLDTPAARQELVEAGQRRLERDYAPSRVAAAWLDAVAEVMR
jgi:glycosyltransferase involved in cell wall biosynthesis